MKSLSTTVLTPVLVVGVMLASSVAGAQQQGPKPEQFIKWRQSSYQVLAWNTGRIKASLDGNFNKDEVVKASTVIAAIAGSGLGALYPAGTDTGSGWHDTRAKPELFTDKRVAELSGDFQREAVELSKVATGGDAASVKQQFGKLTKTCKACHDDYRIKE
jgi:cytochrome c556